MNENKPMTGALQTTLQNECHSVQKGFSRTTQSHIPAVLFIFYFLFFKQLHEKCPANNCGGLCCNMNFAVFKMVYQIKMLKCNNV